MFPFWSRDSKSVGYSRMTREQMKTQLVLARLDGTGEEILTEADTIAFAGTDSISPDGKRVLFAQLNEQDKKGSVRIREIATKAETTVSEFAVEEPSGPDAFPLASWSPDGKSFLVTLREGKASSIYRMTEDGKTKVRLTPEGVNCFGAVWSVPPAAVN